MPPRPKGSTTVLIIWDRVAPRASAPSLSPGGARLNTSRQTEATMGTIISPTTSPATKNDPLNGGARPLEDRDEGEVAVRSTCAFR